MASIKISIFNNGFLRLQFYVIRAMKTTKKLQKYDKK